MKTLTLDTNVIRDTLDARRPGFLVGRQLVELHQANRCEIRITTRLDVDVPPGPLRQTIESLKFLEQPRLGSVFALDYSRLEPGDMLADKTMASEHDNLMNLIFPGSNPNSPRHKNRIADIGHLIAHKLGSRDIFVTSDGAILNQRKVLAAVHKIIVMPPEEAVNVVSVGSLIENMHSERMPDDDQ